MPLTDEHLEEFKIALKDAFNYAELKAIVSVGVNKKIETIIYTEGSLSETVSELVDWADRKGLVDDLFVAALTDSPGNKLLQALDEKTKAPQKQNWAHRIDIVPSMWRAKWLVGNGPSEEKKEIHETMQFSTWSGENEFKGFGISYHGTESEPVTYNYTFKGRVEPVGVVILEYRAEKYPIEGAKNVGVAILEIKDQKNMTGYFSGFLDLRDAKQKERDLLTHPEKSLEDGKFYVPFGSLSHYGGSVEMIRTGRGG